jgi:homoserine O-acetyltransferase/O-succinyltransferase
MPTTTRAGGRSPSGRARPIDTDRYFVICPNILGGCRGTTGPNSVNPETGRPYGRRFPRDHRRRHGPGPAAAGRAPGHPRLRAVVGGSLGGHMVLTWATRFPDGGRRRRPGHLAAADQPGPGLRRRRPQRHPPRSQLPATASTTATVPGPTVGLAIARMLGHITYLSREAMIEKFDAHRFSPRQVQTQFETKLLRRLLPGLPGRQVRRALRRQQLPHADHGHGPVRPGRHARRAGRGLVQFALPLAVMSFSSDWLFPPFQSQEWSTP